MKQEQRDSFPEYARQCQNDVCTREHDEWVNYHRKAEGWECDTQGYATVTRLHPEDKERLMWVALHG